MVKLHGYGNEKLIRRILRLDKYIVIACCPDEYEKLAQGIENLLMLGFTLRMC
jgi:hypothetical protein